MRFMTKIKKLVKGKYKNHIACSMFYWNNNKCECTMDHKCYYYINKIQTCDYFETAVLPQDKELEKEYKEKIKEIINEQQNS